MRRDTRRGILIEDAERGNAIVEFVFVAVVVLIPMVYLLVVVATVQRGRLAVTNAARDIGRAIATADHDSERPARENAALTIALRAQGFAPSDVEVRYVAAAAGCEDAAIAPDFSAGAEFAVCVIRHQQLPAVPTIVGGRGVTEIGKYVVHMDEFRSAT
ncbi:pilus assembly protein [Jatrophihabitans sp. DSM 45814]